MASEGAKVTEYPAAHTSLCEGVSIVGHFRLSMWSISIDPNLVTIIKPWGGSMISFISMYMDSGVHTKVTSELQRGNVVVEVSSYQNVTARPCAPLEIFVYI